VEGELIPSIILVESLHFYNHGLLPSKMIIHLLVWE